MMSRHKLGERARELLDLSMIEKLATRSPAGGRNGKDSTRPYNMVRSEPRNAVALITQTGAIEVAQGEIRWATDGISSI
jgi:hypothetical protein